jgi:hypothetical protein
MPPVSPYGYRWETKTIHPPEADEIGRKLKIAGMSLDSNGYFVGMVKSKLAQCWKGRAMERFFEDYGFARMPRRLEDLGAEVQSHGDKIMTITVTVTEQVPIDGGPTHGR